jgi:2-haloacid dehalogenase
MASPFRAVAFDLGGVLIDWNPRYLYRDLFRGDNAQMERFLAEVCNPAWNVGLDAGRPFSEAVEELVAAHPDQAAMILAYRDRWGEMLGGVFEGTLAIVRELRRAGVPVYALSNWAVETFALTRGKFPFLSELDGIVISGEVGVAKPDARIFEYALGKFGLATDELVFIDDVPANVDAAKQLGIEAILFIDAVSVRAALRRLGFPLVEAA